MPSTFVLVHGAWSGGWCYARVAALLRARGHTVFTPTLTGQGERAHLLSGAINLTTHIEDVLGVFRWERLYDVVLAGHSYGGMVITGVADRAADRVGKIVYLDAANPVNGQSLVDVAGPIILATREDLRVINGVECVTTPGAMILPSGSLVSSHSEISCS